jgi:uncharacterized protein
MAARALLLSGGWDGHRPHELAEIAARALRERGLEVELRDTLAALLDEELVRSVDLIVPNWTMGTIERAELDALRAAVERSTGLGGWHGGAGDAFRAEPDFQFLVGGQFVGHPGGDGVEYEVRIADREHEITRGLEDFGVRSEQYYVHVDPANHVLATTRFPVVAGPHESNGEVDVPVAWTRRWGRGRVFYTSIGHDPAVFAEPSALELCIRGLLWAAGGQAGSGDGGPSPHDG